MVQDAYNSGLDVSGDRLDVNDDDRRLFYTSASAPGTQTVTPTSVSMAVSSLTQNHSNADLAEQVNLRDDRYEQSSLSA